MGQEIRYYKQLNSDKMIYYFIPSDRTIIKYILYIKKDYVIHFNILIKLPVTNIKGITTGNTLFFT